MNEVNTISKNLILSAAQNYNLLRAEGLQHIENLSSDLWTDYNEHDPGITILEALCYAITELGYRTAFDISDLLAKPDGNISKDQCFYTAKNILTVNPLTPVDYRKLLIDLEQIQNAWMIYNNVQQEINLYADCEKDQLAIDDGSKIIPADHQIKLSGLYNVLLDLENNLQWGDLNNTNITYRVPAGDIQNKTITVLFHHLEKLSTDDYKNIVSAIVDNNYAANIQNIQFPSQQPNYHWQCNITVAGVSAAFTLIIRIDSLFRREEKQQAFAYIMSTFTKDFIHDLFISYQKKYLLIEETLLHVKNTLFAHRNLCEDFIKINTVTDQDIALCMDIDVAPDADIEMILANIFYNIQEYFCPSVHFYPLKTLMDKGIAADEIFEGPILSHGFIDNNELQNAQLRQVIRSSDLINIIMDVDGVLAVRNLSMTKYDEDGEPVLPSEAWCLQIPANYKAILNIDRSKIIFYKGKIPLKAKVDETLDTLRYLQAINERNKLYGAEDDLPVPKGNYFELEDYYSIQNDLPQTYGTGIAGLAPSATEERKAQAHQLKAYLLFYDQLLANFFSQLNGAKRLLSIDKTLTQTYFTQYLAEATFPLYQDGVKNVNEIYANPAQMELLMNGSQITSAAWKNLIESQQTFYDRRNSFLDHLLARFAESFNNYVLMMYQVHFDLQQSEAISDDNIIKAKINFLANYPDISSNRGRAYNYCPMIEPVSDPAQIDLPALGNANNISGLEKRAALLTGIALPAQDKFSSYLFCLSMADIIEKDISGTKTFSFIFYNQKDEVILQSVKQDYISITTAANAAAGIAPFIVNASYYYAQKQSDGTYKLFVTDDPNNKTNLLATDGKIYASQAEANKAKALLTQLFGPPCQREGLYLVEHILLRPRTVATTENSFQLMEVCLGKDCHFCGEQDPYTFRASVILPYWPDRFRNIIFHKYFESLIRTEAPAHVSLKICWINNSSMREFEIIYKSWLKALANFAANENDLTTHSALRDANDKLINILQHLHSEYPLATLHDCEESVNTNLVVLGSSVLGTYKN